MGQHCFDHPTQLTGSRAFGMLRVRSLSQSIGCLRSVRSSAVKSRPAHASITGSMSDFAAAKGTHPLPCSQPSDAWLRSLPRGAYTTARTVGRTSVFELSFHINRLAESCRLMLQAEADKTAGVDSSQLLKQHQFITEAARLRLDVIASLHTAVDAFLEAHPRHQGELKLTVLVTWQGRQEVHTHVAALPPRPQPPVKAQLEGAPRSNAAAKDSDWVHQRQALEKDKAPDVNEILLAQGDGAVLEGMSSNFFAVQDGTLYTAGEGVLLGTIRDLAIKVCKHEEIPVKLEAPRLEHFERWEGAAVASTSRLFLPIDELSAPILGQPTRSFQNSEHSLVKRIDELVQAELEHHSEPL